MHLKLPNACDLRIVEGGEETSALLFTGDSGHNSFWALKWWVWASEFLKSQKFWDFCMDWFVLFCLVFVAFAGLFGFCGLFGSCAAYLAFVNFGFWLLWLSFFTFYLDYRIFVLFDEDIVEEYSRIRKKNSNHEQE